MRFSNISAEAQRRRAFLVGLAPALVVLAVITLAPAVYLLTTSLTPLDLTRMEETSGDFSRPWTNYAELWTDTRFHNSVWVQVQLSVVTVFLQLAVGLGVALLLNYPSKFMEAVRTTFLIPMVLPPIVVSIIWKVMYIPEVSPMHRMLEIFGFPVESLITNPKLALWAIAVADTSETRMTIRTRNFMI